MAITWRTVNGPNFAGVGELTRQAGVSMQRGLNTLQGIAEDQRGIVDDNFDNTTNRNNETIAAEINALKSVDAAKQAQDQGTFGLDALRSRFGAQFDAGKAQSLIEGRDDSLRTEYLADQQYNTQLTNAADKPLLAQVRTALAGADNNEAANAVMQSEAFNKLSDSAKATIAEEVNNREGVVLSQQNAAWRLGREKLTAGRQDDKFNREEEDRLRSLDIGNRISDLVTQDVKFEDAQAALSQHASDNNYSAKQLADAMGQLKNRYSTENDFTDTENEQLTLARTENQRTYDATAQAVNQQVAAMEEDFAKLDPYNGISEDTTKASVFKHIASITRDGWLEVGNRSGAGGENAAQYLNTVIAEVEKEQIDQGADKNYELDPRILQAAVDMVPVESDGEMDFDKVKVALQNQLKTLENHNAKKKQLDQVKLERNNALSIASNTQRDQDAAAKKAIRDLKKLRRQSQNKYQAQP